MKNLPSAPLPIEKEVVTDWFVARFVRQADNKLFAHINYTKWSATAKRKTKELMDSFGEPLYAFIHNKDHWKYLSLLGFEPTGNLVETAHPGKEGQLFGEVVYVKGGVENQYLAVCDEIGKLALPFNYIDGYGNLEKIEQALLEKEQAQWETQHYFSDGVYTRETFIPKNTILTGFRHRQKTINILTKGTISVVGVDKLGHAQDKGVLTAPMIIVTEPGIKKIGYAHEDTVFVNSFYVPQEICNMENMDKIEEFIFEREEPACQEL